MKKLTNNDAILCESKEQWDAIIDLYQIKISKDDYMNFESNCINVIGIGYADKKTYKSLGYKITKASKILNSNKELSKRLDKIEKHLGLNTEVTFSGECPKDNEVTFWGGNPNYKTTEIKNELTELPEKWCVCRDYKTALVINDWFNTLKKPTTLFTTDKGYVCSDKSALEFKIPEGYTEITFDQFNKWVLKEDDLNSVEKELEKTLSIREVQVKVTSQEEANECAEIAKACGEKIGSEFSMRFDESNQYFLFGGKWFGVYDNEKNKKTISIQEYRERFGKSTEIDWSKAGQYVINKNNAVWRTTGNHNNHLFEGILIRLSDKSDKPNSELFKTKNKIFKESFKLCTEPITLSNERN